MPWSAATLHAVLTAFRMNLTLLNCFGIKFLLECRKWGFKRWGFKEIRGYLRKKAFFLRYPGFPRCSWHPPEKGEKGRKRAILADFGRFPGREARHPLSAHLLHPHLRQPNPGCKGISELVAGV